MTDTGKATSGVEVGGSIAGLALVIAGAVAIWGPLDGTHLLIALGILGAGAVGALFATRGSRQ